MGFDYEEADRRQQAALRGEDVPSPLDTYDRNHSVAIVANAAIRAWGQIENLEPKTRRIRANYDIPRNVDAKIRKAIRALRELREAALDARVYTDELKKEVA